jgi:hypothetical protein
LQKWKDATTQPVAHNLTAHWSPDKNNGQTEVTTTP